MCISLVESVHKQKFKNKLMVNSSLVCVCVCAHTKLGCKTETMPGQHVHIPSSLSSFPLSLSHKNTKPWALLERKEVICMTFFKTHTHACRQDMRHSQRWHILWCSNWINWIKPSVGFWLFLSTVKNWSSIYQRYVSFQTSFIAAVMEITQCTLYTADNNPPKLWQHCSFC